MVVNPDTLSNKAFTKVNSRPYIRKGSIPNRQAQSQANTTMLFPSRKLSEWFILRTKRSG